MKRKCLVIGIILLFVGTCIIPAIAQDIEKISSPASRGNWLYVGGNGPGNYTTIQNAIDDAIGGDTVFVYDDSSPYIESVIIVKSITLIGENRNSTVIDGNGAKDVIKVSVDWVNISGFTIQNSSRDYPDMGAGIRILSCYNTISGNIIRNNTGWNGEGILLSGDSNSISGNTLTNNTGDSISLSGSNSAVFDNTITHNRIGITLSSGESNTVFNNTITDSQICGVEFGSNNIVSCNIITNDHCGIGIIGISNTISGNIITNNNYQSIWIYDGSDFNNIINNTITNNFYGIYLYTDSNNIIYHNNLINNEQNAYDKGTNTWYNTTLNEGNYWSDYSGFDNDGDGIGDTPYNISGGDNQDLYPFMKPNGWVNQPPNTPIIEQHGNLLCINATDPDGDKMYCYWSFGDGTYTGWMGPYESGHTLCVSHIYSEPGTYELKVKLKDEHGLESNWSEPYNYTVNELKKAFIFGRYTNLTEEVGFITIEAVNIRIVLFNPVQYLHYINREKVTYLEDTAKVLIGPKRIIGFVDLVA